MKLSKSLGGGISAAALVIGLAAPASAAAEPEPITADVLPTWQTNGRVWALESANGVVYAGGDFSSVRPPGAPLGTDEVPRQGFAAFDAATGDLLPCAPSFTTGASSTLTPTVRVIEASPDGSRIYVGGTFSYVAGTGVSNLVSLDTASCQLTPSAQFRRPSVSARVLALHAAGSKLYVAGTFNTVNSQSRRKFAVLSEGGVLDPAAAEFDLTTRAIIGAPDVNRVYVGGDFNTVNGVGAHGLVALDEQSGNVVQTFPDWLPSKSVTKALLRDGDKFFLAAEGTGGGVFDGRLAATIDSGQLLWKDLCLGATQALAAKDGLLYSSSHAHDCGQTPGGFAEGGFRQHLLAQNISDKTIRHWFPDTDEGFPMGVGEPLGPRTMVFAGGELWVGGEFTKVNDMSDDATQWGLVRFAESPDTGVNYATPLTVTSPTRGTVNVRWMTAFDPDDELLTYELYRDGQLVNTQTVASKEWNRPVLSFTEQQPPGKRVGYRLRVLEADGDNIGPMGVTTYVDVASESIPYAGQILADGATHYYRLGDPAGSTSATDMADPDSPGRINATVTFGQQGALENISDTAASFSGSSATVSTPTPSDNPNAYSLEAWFKTNTTSGGKLIGFGDRTSGSSSSYDRHIYMTNAGKLIFGTWTGSANVATSTASYNDNQWHHVVATQGPNGMALYVDGQQVATNPQTNAQPYEGYWRVGGDNLSGWPSSPSSRTFVGTLDEVAVYEGKVLTSNSIAGHYAEGRPSSDSVPPTAPTGLQAQAGDTKVDLSWEASTDNVRVSEYRIYRGDSADFTADASTLIDSTGATNFADSSPAVGKAFYRVAAVDVAGNVSNPSDSASATVKAPVAESVADADTYTNSSAKTANFGTSTSLGVYGTPDVTTYLRFQVPATPDGQTVTKAALTVRTTTLSGAGSGDTVRVRLADNAWDEALVTYNTRPPAGPEVLGALPAGSSPNTTYEIALDRQTLAERAGQEVTLALMGTGSDSLWIWSKESSKVKPTLSLTYEFGDDVESDTEAPTVPAGLSATVSGTDVSLSWQTATDNVAVTGYEIHRGTAQDFEASASTLIGTRPGTTFTDNGPEPGKWFYKVVAVDAAGNRSAASVAAAVSLDAAPVDSVAVADAYTHSLQKTSNYGNSTSLGANGSPDLTTYLRFQVPATPDGQDVADVKLRFRTTSISGAGSAAAFDVRVADDAWDEASVTYNTRPALSGPVVGNISGGTSPSTTYEVNLDSAVLAQYAGQTVTLALTSTGTDSLWTWSKESTSVKPTVTIGYRASQD